MIELKTRREIEIMKVSGQYVGQILAEIQKRAEMGMTTFDLNDIAEEKIVEYGVQSAFKGYRGFPASLCTSINEEVVHGIPSKKKKLKVGDLVSIDFGVIHEGYYGDAACSFILGRDPDHHQRLLLEVTRQSLMLGIEQARVGNRISDISVAVQTHVESHGFSVVREFVGHGIGRSLHEDPQIPNYGLRGEGPLIREGMVLAIEPMVNFGGAAVKVLSDGWTVVTKDSSLSAHFEHTVAVTAGGPEILTMVMS